MLQCNHNLFKVVMCTSWLFTTMPHWGFYEALEYSMIGGA